RRTLCAGQKQRTAGQGKCHAAKAPGSSAAQAARHAKESAQTRSTAAADRRGEEGSGPRLRLREDSAAAEGSRGHALDVHVSHRQGEAQGGRAAGWPLSTAQQSHRRRSCGAVDAVCAVSAAHTAGSRCAGIDGADPAHTPAPATTANQVHATAARCVSAAVAFPFCGSCIRLQLERGPRVMKWAALESKMLSAAAYEDSKQI